MLVSVYMNTKNFLILGLIIIVLAGGFFFLSNNSKQNVSGSASSTTDLQQPGSSTSNGTVSTAPSTTVNADSSIKTFDVEGSNYSFNIKEIKVNKGDKVKINFINRDGFHDWILDEFNAKTKQVKAGETDSVEFTADKTGTFEYYCSVGKHRQMGMVGKFIVE
jgi:plastocyanin